VLLALAACLVVIAFALREPAPGAPTPAAVGTASPTASPTPTPTPTRSATLRSPGPGTSLAEGGDAITRAAAMSRALFASAPVVVLAPVDDVPAQLRAASIGAALGVPTLLTGPDPDAATTTEIDRLGASDVVLVGGASLGADGSGLRVVVAPDGDDAVLRLTGGSGPAAAVTSVAAGGEPAAVSALGAGGDTLLEAAVPEAPPAAGPETPAAEPSPAAGLPTGSASPALSSPSTGSTLLVPTVPASPASAVLVLSDGDLSTLAALATARAAGATVVLVPGGDPRSSSASVRAIAAVDRAGTAVVAVGPAFGSAADLDWRVATAATGVELPGGGQTLFPGRRLVALYGTPGTAALGLLGEQDLPGSIARAQQYAAEYQALTPETVVPAFEIIATVASRGPGDDGNYSDEIAPESLLPWVQAARDAGVYVVIDLQPGRTDFLTQAQQYASLLVEPNVGLALDPEWRLKPDQVHLRQIGSVGVDEVNAVATWLADLTRERSLPQKLFVLHQFAGRMIDGRERLDLSRAELAVMVHVDGQGSQPAKAGTWAALRRDAPAGLWWGWKNFVDEDVPMLTPEQTLQVVPTPDLITYQ